jgi:hypothetical protein
MTKNPENFFVSQPLCGRSFIYLVREEKIMMKSEAQDFQDPNIVSRPQGLRIKSQGLAGGQGEVGDVLDGGFSVILPESRVFRSTADLPGPVRKRQNLARSSLFMNPEINRRY